MVYHGSSEVEVEGKVEIAALPFIYKGCVYSAS